MAIATLANMQKIFVKHTTRSTCTSTTEVADSEHTCDRPSRPKRSRDQKSRDNSELSRPMKERDALSMALIPLQNPTSDKAAHNRTVAEKQVLELEKKIKALESGVFERRRLFVAPTLADRSFGHDSIPTSKIVAALGLSAIGAIIVHRCLRKREAESL